MSDSDRRMYELTNLFVPCPPWVHIACLPMPGFYRIFPLPHRTVQPCTVQPCKSMGSATLRYLGTYLPEVPTAEQSGAFNVP